MNKIIGFISWLLLIVMGLFKVFTGEDATVYFVGFLVVSAVVNILLKENA